MKSNTKQLYIKLIILSLTIALISMASVGCIKRLPVPVYETTDEDGTSVYIDGVRYKELPRLEWAIDNVDEIIGYAGSYDTFIYGLKNDPNRDFVVLKYYWADYYGPGLYRTDKVIPDVSVENVDKIIWEYYEMKMSPEVKRPEIINYYTNTITDKTTIIELFELLETGEEAQNISAAKKGEKTLAMNISLYCSEIPAASFGLGVGLFSGRIVCGRPSTGYVYMPEDLLDRIAGKKIDVSELTED